MWRLWDTDSQVLASDSDESVIFVVEKPVPSIQHPCIVARAAAHALPTFSSSTSDTFSSLDEYWPSILF